MDLEKILKFKENIWVGFTYNSKEQYLSNQEKIPNAIMLSCQATMLDDCFHESDSISCFIVVFDDELVKRFRNWHCLLLTGWDF